MPFERREPGGQGFKTQSEIEEAVWVNYAKAELMPLAPLTRGHILPLSLRL
jgi:hypothetical protein